MTAKMKRIRVLIFVMVGILLLGTVSCSSDNKSTLEQGVKVGIPKDANVKKVTITYIEGAQEIITSAMLQYNMKYKDVKVEGICIPFDSLEDYKKKLSTEILTGEGPDLLYFQPDYFDSLHKVMESGTLYDINQLIAKDTEFKMSDYNETVMDYGVLDGKRCFIPLSYSPRVFATSEKVLDRNNIKIDESGKNWGEWEQIVEKFMASNKDKKRYFFDSYISFDVLLGSYPKLFYDYETKRSLFDCPQFRKLLNFYKKISPAIETENRDIKYQGNIYEALKKNNFLLITDFCYSPFMLSAFNADSLKEYNEEVTYLPFPYLNKSDMYIPVIFNMISINSRCKEKEAAFNFIKLLLSKEMQNYSYKFTQRMEGNVVGTPVNIEAMKEDLQYFSSKYELYPLISEKLKSDYLGLVKNVGKGELIDSQIYNIVNDAVKKYVNSTSTEDQTIKEIDNKVELFLNE